MYLTKKQVDRNKEVISLLKKKLICCCCGRHFGSECTRSRAKDCCLECFASLEDPACQECLDE